MYSGVLALGVGDSVAAVSGTLVGRHKWPGTSKTFEGTFMSVLCQLIVAAAIVYISECNGSVCAFISLSSSSLSLYRSFYSSSLSLLLVSVGLQHTSGFSYGGVYASD